MSFMVGTEFGKERKGLSRRRCWFLIQPLVYKKDNFFSVKPTKQKRRVLQPRKARILKRSSAWRKSSLVGMFRSRILMRSKVQAGPHQDPFLWNKSKNKSRDQNLIQVEYKTLKWLLSLLVSSLFWNWISLGFLDFNIKLAEEFPRLVYEYG